YIRITDIDENSNKYSQQNIVSPLGILEDKYLVKENDILFARTGASTGKTYIYDKNDGILYFAGFLIKANIKNTSNSMFIFMQTKTTKYRRWIELESMRTGQPGINSKQYESYNFSVPSLVEQNKIANFFSLIDKRISLQQEKVSLLREKKQGLMQQLFSRKLRFKDENGEAYPEWEVSSFKEIVTINQGLQIAIDDRYTTPDINRMFYITNEFLRIDSQKKYYIENPSPSVICTKDDILMTRTGNTGKVVTDVEGAFHNNFFKIKYDTNTHNKYFLYYILTSVPIQRKIIQLAGTSTIPDLNHSDFYSIAIAYPCLAEQQKIADLLSTLDSKIEKEDEKLKSLREQKKAFVQQMFV
ncbi:MAG: hypothetical protein ATN35_02440, partial [Epulopiscium sp. Nele67-Bin004]